MGVPCAGAQKMQQWSVRANEWGFLSDRVLHFGPYGYGYVLTCPTYLMSTAPAQRRTYPWTRCLPLNAKTAAALCTRTRLSAALSVPIAVRSFRGRRTPESPRALWAFAIRRWRLSMGCLSSPMCRSSSARRTRTGISSIRTGATRRFWSICCGRTAARRRSSKRLRT